jgi:hypothetical protein
MKFNPFNLEILTNLGSEMVLSIRPFKNQPPSFILNRMILLRYQQAMFLWIPERRTASNENSRPAILYIAPRRFKK